MAHAGGRARTAAQLAAPAPGIARRQWPASSECMEKVPWSCIISSCAGSAGRSLLHSSADPRAAAAGAAALPPLGQAVFCGWRALLCTCLRHVSDSPGKSLEVRWCPARLTTLCTRPGRPQVRCGACMTADQAATVIHALQKRAEALGGRRRRRHRRRRLTPASLCTWPLLCPSALASAGRWRPSPSSPWPAPAAATRPPRCASTAAVRRRRDGRLLCPLHFPSPAPLPLQYAELRKRCPVSKAKLFDGSDIW